MWKAPQRRCSFGQHSMVNRSDSEKLSDANLMFKPEVNLQAVLSACRDELNQRHTESNSMSLDELEYFEVGKASYWPSSHEEGSSMQSYSRKRSLVVSSSNDNDRMVAYRRESKADAGSIEDREERILEVLRQIVRTCTNPDPTLRPTAHEVLSILNMKSNAIREK